MTVNKAANDVCRICKATRLEFHFAVLDQQLWRCRSCGFVQVADEPTAEVLDAIYSANYFTSSKYRGDPVALSRENDRRLQLLERWSSRGAFVLDAGCSTGDFVFHAKDHFQMHGNDYSAFAIETAKKRNPELADRFMAGRIEETRWADKSFDAICMWDVIEHIWDPVPVLVDLLAHLRPGGVILMSTPAVDSLAARVTGRYWPFMTPPEHLSFFSIDAFKAAAGRVGGCEIVYAARRGKWANLAFIAYKITRIAPAWFPAFLLWPLRQWPLNRISMYVPTGDVAYVVMRKLDRS